MDKSFLFGHLYSSETATEKSINNFPGADEATVQYLTEDYINQNLKNLYINVIDPINSAFGIENVFISSCYRCMELNKEIGGSSNSQHVYGLAVDLAVDSVRTEDIFNWCIRNLPNSWDQLIWEYPENGQYYKGTEEGFSWVHVSWAEGYLREKTTVMTSYEALHKHYSDTYEKTWRGSRDGHITQATHGIPIAEQSRLAGVPELETPVTISPVIYTQLPSSTQTIY